MSGYDALDELYERLRETEETQHAQRAGGITPEAIRAARGGVSDGHGRGCHVAGENAADGDSSRDTGVPRDTRERIEADAWEAARLDMSRTWEERRDAIVALLDRQAALTEREYMERSGISELRHKVDELNAQNTRLNAKWAAANTQVEKLQAELYARKLRESAAEDYDFSKMAEMWKAAYEGKCKELASLQAVLDAHGNTHVELPLDADGVPIHVGDTIEHPNGKHDRVRFITINDNVPTFNERGWVASKCRHVEPRTVEDVLRELADVARLDRAHDLDDGDIEGFAAEIRELMEVE